MDTENMTWYHVSCRVGSGIEVWHGFHHKQTFWKSTTPPCTHPHWAFVSYGECVGHVQCTHMKAFEYYKIRNKCVRSFVSVVVSPNRYLNFAPSELGKVICMIYVSAANIVHCRRVDVTHARVLPGTGWR